MYRILKLKFFFKKIYIYLNNEVDKWGPLDTVNGNAIKSYR